MQHDAHSWAPIDLLAAGDAAPEPPTIGGLVYPGRLHLVSGEPDAGKSWLLLALTVQQIRDGNRAAYIDFEMSGREVLERVRALGLTDDQVRDGLIYLRPAEPLEERTVIADLEAMLDTARPTIVTVDSFIGALALHRGDPNSAIEVERVYRTVAEPFLAADAAVVFLDHVVKNKDDRGRWATGSERKVGRADVHLSLDSLQRFGRGRTGRMKISVGKDRPGWLPRPRAGELELASDPDTGYVTWTIHPATTPEHTDEQDAGAWRPTVLETRVVQYLKKHPEPLTRSALANAVTGNRKYLLQAIDNLLTDGMLEQTGTKVALADVPERSSERSKEHTSSGRNGHVPPSYIGTRNASTAIPTPTSMRSSAPPTTSPHSRRSNRERPRAHDARGRPARRARRAVPTLAVSPEEAAASLGVSRDFLDEHIAPELHWVRRGRRKFVAVAELERWLERAAALTIGGAS